MVVVVHGGFWRARYDLTLGTPLAVDLALRGCAAWNIEYRRVGGGGGWPTTARDAAAAVDFLASLGDAHGEALRQAEGTLRAPGTNRGQAQLTVGGLDLSRVVALGHSAGAQLAAWLAGRARLGDPFGPPLVPVTGVVSQAGVLDLERAAAARMGAGAVDDFMGSSTAEVDWARASPRRQLPLGVPIRCVHGDRDTDVPIDQSREFVAAARAVGDDATLVTVPGGDHFGLITPGDPGWAACAQAVQELLSIS